jgi:hypothetical protein
MSFLQAALQNSAKMAPSCLAQWVGIAVTFLAVLVALFKESALGLWQKPRLGARCSKDSPWTVRNTISVFSHDPKTNTQNVLWTGDCYYVRIEVQVYASKLETLALDGTAENRNDFVPLNMKWSNSPPTAPTMVLDGISPQMGAFCDLVSLCDPANPYQDRRPKTPQNVTVGQLQLEVDPANKSHLLSPGRYQLTLRIAAANANPINRILVFEHKGQWYSEDNEMRRNCLVVDLK